MEVPIRISANRLRIRDDIDVDGKRVTITYVDSSFKDMIRFNLNDGSSVWKNADEIVKVYNGNFYRLFDGKSVKDIMRDTM